MLGWWINLIGLGGSVCLVGFVGFFGFEKRIANTNPKVGPLFPEFPKGGLA